MKNRLYIFSAVIICLSIILCACGKEPEKEPTTAPVSIEETLTVSVPSPSEKETVTYTDVSGYHVVSIIEPTTEKRTQPTVPTRHTDPTYRLETLYQPHSTNSSVTQVTPEKPTVTKNADTTAPTFKPTEPITFPEIADGLTLRFKSGSVDRGYSSTVAVEGTAGKEYTIEVYRSNGATLTSDKLSPKTAGDDGVVVWSIPTGNLTSGNTKVIIREKGSDKYIQTSISIK